MNGIEKITQRIQSDAQADAKNRELRFSFAHKSNRGDIYVSTIGAGIFRLCSESGHWQLIPVRLGNVSYDVVLSIAEELSGNIWFVSDNSLVRLFTDGNIQTFNQDFFGKNITFSEGIPMLKDNKLFLGTADGFIEMSFRIFGKISSSFILEIYSGRGLFDCPDR